MTHVRVCTMRALALSLALLSAYPVAAQAPAQPAPSENSDAASAAAAAKANELKKQLKAALDQSAALAGAGKVDDAIKLLEDTDKRIPGDALIASALGAAFELKGQNADALDWVREGIKRDAAQHGASEWLHARMLEARLALSKDPNWFAKNNVLGLDFGKNDVPVAPEILPIEAGRIKGADQLLDQIGYQLAARTKVVKPPDPVVGDLYASAGDLAIAGAVSPLDDRKSTLHPEQYYQRALEYGAPHADLIRRRLARYQADLAALPPLPKQEVVESTVVSNRFAPPPEKSYRNWIYAGAGAGLIVIVLAIATVLDRRRRKHADANPPAPLPDV